MSNKQQSTDRRYEAPSSRDNFLSKSSERKRSLELDYVHNQSNTEESRINKLVNFSVTRKLKKQKID